MAKNSGKRLPIWSGNFGSWNPNVIRNPLNKIVKSPLEEALGKISDGLTSQNPLIDVMIQRYKKAVELLKSVNGIEKFIKDGIPLCPVLVPKLSDLTEDDISVNKFGGLPNLLTYWQYNYHERLAIIQPNKKHAKDPNQLEKIWPRCGVCHEYLSFVGHVDISDGWDAIHQLTKVKDDWYSYSSVGVDSERGFGRQGMEWTFWMCDAPGHFQSPNSNAHIWVNSYMIYPDYPEIRRKTKNNLPSREERCALAKQEAVDFCAKHNIKNLLPLKKVDSFDLKFDLDWYVSRYEASEAIEEVVESNEDVFNNSRNFKLFGAPESQQEEARFFACGNRSYIPRRLTPVLAWNDNEHDVTHQMYADTISFTNECKTDMFAKVDSSNT